MFFSLFCVLGVIMAFLTFFIVTCLDELYNEIKNKNISEDTVVFFKWYFIGLLLFGAFYYGAVQQETQKFYECESKSSIITDCRVIDVDEKNCEIILMKNDDTRKFTVNSIGSFVNLNNSRDKLSTLKKNDSVDIKFYESKEKNYIIGFININYKENTDSFSKEKF